MMRVPAGGMNVQPDSAAAGISFQPNIPAASQPPCAHSSSATMLTLFANGVHPSIGAGAPFGCVQV
jgi:hypothetical protein